MHHRNAPLTPAGRLRLIERCLHRPIAHVAAEAGISRQCLSKWVSRYRQLGEAGLQDASSAPKASPARTSPQVVEQIEELRREKKVVGPNDRRGAERPGRGDQREHGRAVAGPSGHQPPS